MKIIDVSYVYDDTLQTEEELLRQHYTTVGWAEALHRKGVEIIVLKRFSKDASFQKNGVRYYFFNDHYPGNIKAWQISLQFLRKIVSFKPDIVHLHNFSLSIHTLLLRRMLGKKTAIIIQHHGGPYPGGFKKSIHDRLNNIADGFFFTTVEQGKQWFRNKRFHPKIYPVMEGATFFNYETRDAGKNIAYTDRTIAITITKLSGQPVFLWVGRLDANKDPLTVLKGFETILKNYPEAALFMIFSGNQLLHEVKTKIAGSEVLKNRVHLLGNIPHEKMEKYYESADYFVLGSHYEGSGYALSEALKCGCIPVVTDIPSFRMMTKNGELGALWEPGNKDSFFEGIIRAMKKPLKANGEACIEFYNQNLSFDAIAEQALKQYRKIAATRTGKNNESHSLRTR
jgi:glycosyltransferase involved in cell wall biosynthesis